MAAQRRDGVRQALAGLGASLAVACGAEPTARSGPAAGWPVYGGDAGGSRYSPLDEIAPGNVARLELAWEYHTGDLPDDLLGRRNHAFQATPILVDDALAFCTPRSRVVALDAETGAERWVFDPGVDLSVFNLNCRGVASWRDPEAAPGAACATRIFAATADARLFALDARSGRPCPGFGAEGSIDFSHEVPFLRPGEYGISSPPVVLGDAVIVGSSVAENRRVDMPGGEVQAFDARTGTRRWRWDPIPREPGDPARASWEGASADRTGAANVWSVGSADPERDLVFQPTSSPSPDFYGGERAGDNRWADSVVALRGSTGELVWAFQTVHHDLWDYDVAPQPVLVDFPTPAGGVPAVVQATKMGNLFVLERESGEPLVPVRERPVPQSTVPGERTAATQPFPEWPPPLVPQALRPEEAFGLTPWDRARCREQIAAMRSEGVFTPPSFEGTVVFPGSAGGSNWGSVAFDPERRLLVANTTRLANTLRLLPRAEPDPPDDGSRVLATAAQEGTPYKAVFGVLVSPFGIPCNPPPWGALAALDLEERALRWEVPLGTTRDLAPLGISLPWGVPNMGGPIATASGLVFIAAALDDYLRAFETETGRELWRGRLPAGGQATPMTYRVRANGRQLVVVAAGGHASMRTRRGDSLVAFALP
jgi:quinoprotein glucose dehydrogenase